MLSDGIVFIDGEYVKPADAKMSVFDVGMVWGDAVFDVTSTWDGRFFMLEQYLDRFEHSLERFQLSNPYSREEVRRICAECVDRSGYENTYVKFQLWRGLSPGYGEDLRLGECHFMAYAIPYVWLWGEEQCRNGANLHLSSIERVSSNAIDQRAKNYNRMDLVQARHDAFDRGCIDTILCGPDGNLTEGPGYNIFVVRDGKVSTPDHNILHGITRQAVLELCELEGVDTEVRPVHPDELGDAQEVFASSTAGGVMPVIQVDGRPIGNGHPGLVTTRLQESYWTRRESGWHTTAVADILAAQA